jgi:hypothetical protein
MRSKSPTLRSVIVAGRDLDLVDADQRAPLAELLVDRLEDRRRVELVGRVAEPRLEALAGPDVGRIEIEDVAEHLDGAGGVTQVLLADLPEAVLQLEVARPCRRRGRRS